MFMHTDPKLGYCLDFRTTHIYGLQDYLHPQYKLMLKCIFKIIRINTPISIKDTKGIKKSSYWKPSKI